MAAGEALVDYMSLLGWRSQRLVLVQGWIGVDEGGSSAMWEGGEGTVDGFSTQALPAQRVRVQPRSTLVRVLVFLGELEGGCTLRGQGKVVGIGEGSVLELVRGRGGSP